MVDARSHRARLRVVVGSGIDATCQGQAISSGIKPGEIRASDREQFKEEPPVQRAERRSSAECQGSHQLRAAERPIRDNAAVDTSALTAILRNISREPRIGKFTLVAFNLQEQRVVYRQDNAEKIDFPALRRGARFHQHGDSRPETPGRETRRDGIPQQVDQRRGRSQQTRPDAVVFAGPKALLDESVPADSLREIGDLDYPVFYMNYNLYPQSVPWNDAIGKAVKFLKGYEYTISKPRDLWFAVTEMVSRIVKTKQGRRSGTSSSE